jgi:hypothetical protein
MDVTLPPAYEEPIEHPVDVLTWMVIPALPNIRIEWEADWCTEGSVPVHAWLITIDVVGAQRDETVDTS